MAACCGPGAAPRARGRRLVPGGASGTCACSEGLACTCTACVCARCPCKPERVLTAALRRAPDAEQIDKLAKLHWGRLNGTHVAAGLNRLAELAASHESTQGDGNERAPLDILLEVLERPGTLSHKETRTVSTCMWALAALHAPAERVPHTLLATVQTAADSGRFSARDASMTAWSLATLSRHGARGERRVRDDALLEAVGGAARATAAEAGARDVSNLLWAAATLGCAQLAGGDAAVRVSTELTRRGKLTPRHLASCVWGATRLNISGSGSGSSIRSSCSSMVSSANDRGHAYAEDLSLGMQDGAGTCCAERSKGGIDGVVLNALLDAAADELTHGVLGTAGDSEAGPTANNVAHASAADVSNILWAFAAARRHPGAHAFDELARSTEALAVAGTFSPAETASALWALATLLPAQRCAGGCCAGRSAVRALAARATDIAHEFGPHEAANALWALAAAGNYGPATGVLWQRVEALFREGPSEREDGGGDSPARGVENTDRSTFARAALSQLFQAHWALAEHVNATSAAASHQHAQDHCGCSEASAAAAASAALEAAERALRASEGVVVAAWGAGVHEVRTSALQKEAARTIESMLGATCILEAPVELGACEALCVPLVTDVLVQLPDAEGGGDVLLEVRHARGEEAPPPHVRHAQTRSHALCSPLPVR